MRDTRRGEQALYKVSSPCPGRSWLLATVRRGHHLDPLSALLATSSSWNNVSWPRSGPWSRAARGDRQQPHCLLHATRHLFPATAGSFSIECELSCRSGAKPEALANSSFFEVSKRTPLRVQEPTLKTGHC